MVVQWLRLQTSNAAGVWVRSPVRETSIPHAEWHGQKKKIKSNVSINFPLDVYSKDMIKTFSRNIYALGKTVDYHTRQGEKNRELNLNNSEPLYQNDKGLFLIIYIIIII